MYVHISVYMSNITYTHRATLTGMQLRKHTHAGRHAHVNVRMHARMHTHTHTYTKVQTEMDRDYSPEAK